MKIRSILFFLLIVTYPAFSQNFKEVFKSGEDGYKCYRIPAIVKSKSGKLLAFAEARKNSCSDTDNIDLVLKTSVDNGENWSDLSVVWDDGDNTCGNPAPIVDLKSGEIVLLTTWNLGGDHESEIIAGSSKDTRRVFVLRSNDEGKSWAKPTEITKDVKKENWAWYATGPGNGIQISKGKFKGRMIVACDYVERITKKGYSHIIYSDDSGYTWKLGGISEVGANESTVAELSSGNLMLNMRNYTKDKFRKISISKDGGENLDGFYSDTMLEEPICQGSLISYNVGKKTVLAFSNPASQTKREKMTIKLSYDDGKTWKSSILINEGPSAYSNLVNINKNSIGLLYEGGISSPYESIRFSKVSKVDFK